MNTSNKSTEPATGYCPRCGGDTLLRAGGSDWCTCVTEPATETPRTDLEIRQRYGSLAVERGREADHFVSVKLARTLELGFQQKNDQLAEYMLRDLFSKGEIQQKDARITALEREARRLRDAGDNVARRLQDALGKLDAAPVKPTTHWAESYLEHTRPRIERALEEYQAAIGESKAAAGEVVL